MQPRNLSQRLQQITVLPSDDLFHAFLPFAFALPSSRKLEQSVFPPRFRQMSKRGRISPKRKGTSRLRANSAPLYPMQWGSSSCLSKYRAYLLILLLVFVAHCSVACKLHNCGISTLTNSCWSKHCPVLESGSPVLICSKGLPASFMNADTDNRLGGARVLMQHQSVNETLTFDIMKYCSIDELYGESIISFILYDVFWYVIIGMR